MAELSDYSGKFDPGIRDGDFSKVLLVDLLNAYAEYVRRIDNLWYLAVKQGLGEDEAFADDMKIWEKMTLHELDVTCSLFKIRGNDVSSMMKALQMSSWLKISKLGYHMQLKSPSHSVLTITNCPTLATLEREGSGREEKICLQIETKRFNIIAGFFNPMIEVKALKLPPRQGPDETACLWEFILKDKQ
ncbi:DUF6125 family protein [Chloroflexota bacterium]